MVDSPSSHRDWKFFPWKDILIHSAINWGSWLMWFRPSNPSGPFQVWDLYLLLWLPDFSVKLRWTENLTLPSFLSFLLSRKQVSLTRGAGQTQRTLNSGRERSLTELSFMPLQGQALCTCYFTCSSVKTEQIRKALSLWLILPSSITGKQRCSSMCLL